MTREIVRTYTFTARDVREALCEWVRAKSLPVPQYVGNAGTTRWREDNGNVIVEWSEKDEVPT